MGRESVVACIPTASFMSGGSCAPMENSPPGIQTMPSGASPGGGVLFSTVGRNAGAAGMSRPKRTPAQDVERIRLNADSHHDRADNGHGDPHPRVATRRPAEDRHRADFRRGLLISSPLIWTIRDPLSVANTTTNPRLSIHRGCGRSAIARRGSLTSNGADGVNRFTTEPPRRRTEDRSRRAWPASRTGTSMKAHVPLS